MTVQNILFELLKQDDFNVVIEYLQAQKCDLKEIFEIFSQSQTVTFWNVILSNIRSMMPTLSIQCSSSDSTDDKNFDDNLSTLRCVLGALSAHCLVSKFKPPAIFDIILLSQNVLMCTKNSPVLSAVKSLVSKLSEMWWLNNEEGAENLMPQLITFLLMSTLGMDGHDVDIKRLYALRGGFLLLDFEEASISFIRELIQRSFVHPSYLKVKEGQKLLSFLLNVNQGLLINLVAAVIKPQLASGNKTVAGTYGRIFYHAWIESHALKGEEEVYNTSDNDGNVQASAQAMEDTIQNFLREGIHAAEPKYFRGVRSMLQAFHDVQRSKLDAMLLRVYDPILWRSLRCANAQVRAQAAVVFLDVFPLQHADGRAEDNDKILQKQFDLLAALLTDSDQHVRAHAALGVCHILKEYWESLPLNTTHNILKFLIDTLSVDASCANVRHAVFVGLGELFQQPLTHSLLKQLLPLLRNSIHDKSEKVRVAFMKILCQVKGIRGMHFYDIVPVDHLLARMAADRNCPTVCMVMTELLLNSFYPQSEVSTSSPETEQLNRCLQFISKEPVAAEVFYSYLHHFISIGQAAKLITVMFTYLVTAEARAASAGDVGEDADETGGKRRRTPKSVPLLLGFAEKLGLMRLVHKLLESVESELAVQHLSRDLIAKYLTEEHTRSLLASSAASESVQAVHLLPVAVQLVACAVSIRQLANVAARKTGRQPAAFALNDLLADCFLPVWTGAVELENGKTEMARSRLSMAFVEVFSSAGQAGDLLNCILASFEASGSLAAKPTSKKESSKSKAAGAVMLPFAAAVDLLTAFGTAGLSDSQLTNSTDAIFAAARGLVDSVSQRESDSDPFGASILRVLQLWASSALHHDAQAVLLLDKNVNGQVSFPKVTELLHWSSKRLLPNLCRPKKDDFACRLLSMVLAMLSDLFYLDLQDEVVCLTLRDWLLELHGRGKEHPAAFSRDTSLLMPSLLRISSLLSLSKDQVDFHVGELSVSLLSVLLLRMDCATSDDKEETAVLNMLGAAAVAEAAVQSCLVRLADELESYRETGENDKGWAAPTNSPRSSSGIFLHVALIEASDDKERTARVHRVLSGWQIGAAPYSVRKPLHKVSQMVVAGMLQQLEAVSPSFAKTHIGDIPVKLSGARAENKIDNGDVSRGINANLWQEII